MDRIKFKINGCEYSVGSEVSSDVMLLDYIRNTLELRGTKYMCRQAGCGACIVAAAKSPGAPIEAVNSCMVSITSCKGWNITTIEEVGNRKKGYHVVQRILAQYNGTQCGYCTPGWVMSMYSLLKSRKDLTMLEIEQSFAGNICRCTGYRPILEAYKKFAKDAPVNNSVIDIEDLQLCTASGNDCTKSCEEDDWCIVTKDDVQELGAIEICLKDGKRWFKVNKIHDVLDLFEQQGTNSYQLVAGNTAKGVYPTDEVANILIDIANIDELKGYKLDQNLIIGAGTTLTELLNIYQILSQEDCFAYLQNFYDHLSLVAHIPVRNIGSIAGNLMIKHQHNEFPSDLFLMFETVGAQMTVLSSEGKKTLTMRQFLELDMKGVIIINIMLPPLGSGYTVITFKVMPRSQNAHAVMNAGFLYKLTRSNKVQQARIVFGGLSPNFVRSGAAEKYLIGKQLFTNETLQATVKILQSQLVVTDNPPEPSVAYRKRLALGLFYKSLLSLCPDEKLDARFRSGSIRLRESRPVSDGRQIFDTNPTLWPLNQPIPKVEALIQCAGEAKYVEDLPSFPHEVFGSLVLSTIPLGRISSIDPTQALAMPGVIAFYSAKDIPGLNSFTPADDPEYITNEEVFSSGQINYYNQPIGVIVAETRHIANVAAKKVNVVYKNVKKPVIDIKETKKDSNRITLLRSSNAKQRGTDVTKVIRGSNTIYGQYHFTMETIVCVTRPSEEGLEVFATSQWMDAMQVMISRALKIDANRIDVHVRRLGGGYGFKISRSIQVAIACSLIVQKLNVPCRIIMPLTSNTRAFGKRFPCSSDFEVGVNNSGVIQYINYDVFEDNGFTINEQLSLLGVDVFNNCYDNSRWNYKCFNATTDTAKNTWCRAPGTMETIAMTELLIEQIAYELSLDPIEVRLANFDPNYNDLKIMLEKLKDDAEYAERKASVNKFNVENRWKKRGLRFALLRWIYAGPRYFEVNMAVFHSDGTVAITHGGIEIGQGINTKAAQICAYFLKIPLSKIQVKATNTTISPNCAVTGGSVTSQNIGIGVERCCQQLLSRLEAIRIQMKSPTWEQLITKAFEAGVDLQAHGLVNAADAQSYNIYGVALSEAEIDVLTGESEVLRVDIMEDVGQSVSPEIDIGQVEGAFTMGLGYWTSEELVYDKNTGELLTDRTWNYYVPQARDIPQDLRVYFRKNSYSTRPILGSKATGEPPICLAISVPFAFREAISSARQDSGIPSSKWFNIDGPYTVEKICMASATKLSDFKFY